MALEGLPRDHEKRFRSGSIGVTNTRRVRNFRASDEEYARWHELSQLERLTTSDWIRRRLNESADMIEAERRRTEAQVQERKRLRDGPWRRATTDAG
jgi:hypothetical protein